jgi:hypothetical protein
MVVKIVDEWDIGHGEAAKPKSYKEFTDLDKANEFIQELLKEDYSVVGVISISADCIELYYDQV